eukprot:CAMPEP_0170458194 /NCGR_PEP_ID=MMETSP0123-20130129/5235_1 /TAXON_ID=182087 /ORGANISM="Favella ehrenbergii, Strain Fehren 1" /LENGTH=58 /DNA_ID=CAMNT_0010722241 /DNA_START=402 /DNA_END=578 /DNA_ORIENTATION=-
MYAEDEPTLNVGRQVVCNKLTIQRDPEPALTPSVEAFPKVISKELYGGKGNEGEVTGA